MEVIIPAETNKLNLNFALGQLNFTTGHIENNINLILSACERAKNNYQADIIIFPELALSGYPPEDLLFRKSFHEKITAALDVIQKNLPAELGIILGYPEACPESYPLCYNSAIIMTREKILANYRKQILPNYGVFDEKRYFKPGQTNGIFSYKNYLLGIVICEDLWFPETAKKLSDHQVQIIISINASPFDQHKNQTRLEKMQLRSQETRLPIIYVNHCGAQDDLIFDGSSFVLDKQQTVCYQAPFGQECIGVFNFAAPSLLPQNIFLNSNITHNLFIFNPVYDPDIIPPNTIKINQSDNACIYQALVIAVRDYVHKNYFKKILLGFSGGIDSSLTLTIAMDALGKENLLPVIMPSRYTSELSLTAAKKQLVNMGITDYKEISIEPLFEAFLSSLNLNTESTISTHAVTLQNIQARIRAVILMALSNEMQALVLNTSNKSELAVGYGTLYGDMCGAYAVIKDLWKTQVYALARYRNEIGNIIPADIIARAPSAELSENQLDTDNLPPYDLLDNILKHYIENNKSPAEIIALGFDASIVKQVIRMIVHNEHKRKQGPLGPRVSTLAFTRERRYPITSVFDAI